MTVPEVHTSPPNSAWGSAAKAALAEIWQQVLGVEVVGPDDDFFELGGHSMLAAQVVAAARERLGMPIGIRLLFDHPTVRELTGALETKRRGDQPEGK